MSKHQASLRLNRRRFLGVSSGVAGGLLVPHLWTGVCAGAASKNEKLNMQGDCTMLDMIREFTWTHKHPSLS